jgi:hypothetical protein
MIRDEKMMRNDEGRKDDEKNIKMKDDKRNDKR